MSGYKLSGIVYDDAQPAKTERGETTYARVLEQTQNYISENHSQALASTVMLLEARETVRQIIEQYLTQNSIYVPGMDIHQLTTNLYRDMAGYSFLEEYLADPEIEEIIANSYDDIEIIDKSGRHKVHKRFSSAQQAYDITRRLVRNSGHTLDNKHLRVDAFIAPGVRITAVMQPLIDVGTGVAFNIRKQRLTHVTAEQLIEWETATGDILEFLRLCLNFGASVSIAGRTGSGKTTLAAYLLNNLDESRRIITIEETREILIDNPIGEDGLLVKSILPLCTRISDDASLNVTMQDLVITSLRQCPDIITMAEMRGAEAKDAQEAARTGHTVVSTLHANSAKQAYSRIMTMYQMCEANLPAHMIMELVVDAFPIMVYMKQLPGGTRRVTEVVEACGTHDGVPKVRTIFRYLFREQKWVREESVSDNLAELLLSNGADVELVEKYAEPRASPKACK